MEATSLPRPRGIALPRRLLAALDDDRLVAQLRNGNQAAFEVVYDRYHRGLLGFCRHLLGSREEAEDAVQQTFASAYDGLVAGDREIRLGPWLYTIARNRCISLLRARREQPHELEGLATAGLSEAVQQRDDLRTLLADLRDLPEPQRAALVLAEVSGLGHADIGEILGCPVSKVKSLVFQARSGLIERRQARETPCGEIREQLAVLSGGSLRRGPLRRHLAACPGCAEYRQEIKRQRQMLAVALPVIPTVGLKSGVLSAVGLGGTGGGGAAAAMGGAGVAASAKAGAAKLAVVAAAGGAAVGGGTYAVTTLERDPVKSAAPAAGEARPAPEPPSAPPAIAPVGAERDASGRERQEPRPDARRARPTGRDAADQGAGSRGNAPGRRAGGGDPTTRADRGRGRGGAAGPPTRGGEHPGRGRPARPAPQGGPREASPRAQPPARQQGAPAPRSAEPGSAEPRPRVAPVPTPERSQGRPDREPRSPAHGGLR